ncbi:unnamed protein product, partial [Larinioides sclopetarius]
MHIKILHKLQCIKYLEFKVNMNHKTWLLLAVFLTLTTETFASRAARLFSEINFARCLCAAPVPERLQRIQCMSQFLQGRRFTLREAVQYCGYTSYVTKFGRFTGRKLNMPLYNPWDFRYDLYTNETCRYSGYHPGAAN